MNSIEFQQIKPDIVKALDALVAQKKIADPEGFVLLDGFATISLQNQIGTSIFIGGPSVPSVVVIAKSTGLVLTFALKALLPSVKI